MTANEMDIGPTAQQLREFEQDGVTCLRGALNPEQVEQLRRDVESCLDDDDQMIVDFDSGRRAINGFFLWTRNAGMRSLACSSHLPVLAARFMNSSKVNLFCDRLFIKEPGTPNYATMWHNDQPTWVVRGSQVLTFWIALDSVTKTSGAVEFIRGSHRWDCPSNPATCELPIDVEGNRGRFDIIHYDLAPGDITVHHGMTIHGAGGNHTAAVRRRGYAIGYAGDDAFYEPLTSFVAPEEHGLAPGQALDCPLFPVVYRARPDLQQGT